MKRGERIAQSVPAIESRILSLRGLKVILDSDLAALYGVTTKALNQAVKRNANRFPADFLFQLSAAEKAEVVTTCDHLRRLHRFMRLFDPPPEAEPPRRQIGFHVRPGDETAGAMRSRKR